MEHQTWVHYQALKKALASDPEFAWSWHCLMAVPIMEFTDVSHAKANEVASFLMQHMFSIDTSTNKHYKAEHGTSE